MVLPRHDQNWQLLPLHSVLLRQIWALPMVAAGHLPLTSFWQETVAVEVVFAAMQHTSPPELSDVSLQEICVPPVHAVPSGSHV